ncbi:MAG TPA: formate dehydrogenase subunit gamma [Bryobacteraceae bacterium]|nr:formate dehydrogenase subunit gamma [Bryobacteraceae bacterium]
MSASQAIPKAQESRIVRYTLDERIHHWLAGLSYVYCLITGLAFWSPYLYWLAAVVGGGAVARFWHPWSGVVFTISVVWMYKLWHKDMATTDADWAWSKAMKYYVENDDEKLPPAGRFNYGQKLFFWLMLWGAILLFLSGLGLWFVESIPAWLRHLSIAVHVIAALVTIAGFIIHVYMGTAMVRGGFSAIVTGEVTSSWARHHHRLWYEKAVGRK